MTTKNNAKTNTAGTFETLVDGIMSLQTKSDSLTSQLTLQIFGNEATFSTTWLNSLQSNKGKGEHSKAAMAEHMLKEISNHYATEHAKVDVLKADKKNAETNRTNKYELEKVLLRIGAINKAFDRCSCAALYLRRKWKASDLELASAGRFFSFKYTTDKGTIERHAGISPSQLVTAAMKWRRETFKATNRGNANANKGNKTTNAFAEGMESVAKSLEARPAAGLNATGQAAVSHLLLAGIKSAFAREGYVVLSEIVAAYKDSGLKFVRVESDIPPEIRAKINAAPKPVEPGKAPITLAATANPPKAARRGKAKVKPGLAVVPATVPATTT